MTTPNAPSKIANLVHWLLQVTVSGRVLGSKAAVLKLANGIANEQAGKHNVPLIVGGCRQPGALVLLLIVLAMFSHRVTAQSMTRTASHSGTLSMVDHHPHCGGAAGTLNCWHQETSTFSGVWATPRGMLATDSSGCIWAASSPVKLVAWTKQTALGCNLTNPQYDSNGNLFALDVGSGNLKFVEDVSGKWKPVNGAVAVQFSIATDGEQFFGKINAAGAVNVTADPTHAWTAKGTGYKYILVLTSQSWLLVRNNGTIWLDSSDTLTQIGTNSNAVTLSGNLRNDQAGNPMIYYLGTDNCVYHMNYAAPTKWDKLNGCGMTALASGGPLQVMAIGGTGGTHLYRFGETSPTMQINYGGQVSCNVPAPYGQLICSQFTHTAQVTACWGSHGCHTQSQPQWLGPGSWSLSVISEPQDDPIACLDNPLLDGCTPNENGNMNCSGGGSDTQNNDFDYGVSIDARRWIGDTPGPNGEPAQSVILDDTGGLPIWKGRDYFHHVSACVGGLPTCTTADPLLAWDNCTVVSPEWYTPCYEQVHVFVYDLHIADYGSPWIIRTPWIEELSTGILLCAPNVIPIFPTFGNLADQPICQ
jgi:hypothetical protein